MNFAIYSLLAISLVAFGLFYAPIPQEKGSSSGNQAAEYYHANIAFDETSDSPDDCRLCRFDVFNGETTNRFPVQYDFRVDKAKIFDGERWQDYSS